uniref:Energy transducer TonB n=1 Tax=Desulfobacca acetoxidans TaxID=60893 RepID=A0A7C3V4C7_9BACT
MAVEQRWEGGNGRAWILAVLGSALLHSLAAALLFHWDVPARPRPKKVVVVEPISLAAGLSGRQGGGGNVQVPEKPKALPAAKEKLNPVRAAKKAAPRPVTELPPPELARPTPIKPPPPLSVRLQTDPGRAPAASPASTGSGSGKSGGGAGSGVSTGSGTGIGAGSGTGAGGAGSGSGSPLQAYLQQVRSLLEQKKHYPALARRQHQEGVAVLRFTVAASGRIEAVQLLRSSGHPLLDQEAQETVQRVRSFPPFPPGLGRERLTIEIPLAFRLLGS